MKQNILDYASFVERLFNETKTSHSIQLGYINAEEITLRLVQKRDDGKLFSNDNNTLAIPTNYRAFIDFSLMTQYGPTKHFSIDLKPIYIRHCTQLNYTMEQAVNDCNRLLGIEFASVAKEFCITLSNEHTEKEDELER